MRACGTKLPCGLDTPFHGLLPNRKKRVKVSRYYTLPFTRSNYRISGTQGSDQALLVFRASAIQAPPLTSLTIFHRKLLCTHISLREYSTIKLLHIVLIGALPSAHGGIEIVIPSCKALQQEEEGIFCDRKPSIVVEKDYVGFYVVESYSSGRRNT